jgi:molybdate transport system ATP-binding protein
VRDLDVTLSQPAPIPLDAAFTCRAGEVLALVGPSGAGKTTILRAIAGLHRPCTGRVAIGDEAWLDHAAGVDLPPHRRRVGLVFQNYALFPHMSASANLMAAMGHLPRGARRARAAELLALVNLAGLEERRPAELSGGQQQRVAVARALARDPLVLLLDEPFAAVDRMTRERLYRELADIRRRLEMPVVLVTHDLDEAALLADRMCLLHRGRALQQGPPRDLTARPATVTVARLVGHRNLFEARIADHEGGVTGLAWAGRRLEARARPDLAIGARVAWLIPPGRVVLHRRDRPSDGERENPVHGRVVELTVLGETAHLTLALADEAGRLGLPVGLHVAERNQIAVGAAVTVSLIADAIHLMPPEPAS